jgi:hypothetical protein
MAMKSFTDESGAAWMADAEEEQTPRHHGRWFLVFRAADGASGAADASAAVDARAADASLAAGASLADGAAGERLALPEVRWQTRATAERTLRSMSEFELRRRLNIVRERALLAAGASPTDGAAPEALRGRTNASAG